ncbi:beta-1,4-N-acetylgalactosaminyltransferase bre-4-like, partial [Anopheles albimanus]|uniref:beta-1,4-N-acetylgalactosaminyltransferase bre-4-like n=1 Tax=Anopheles albimanus TaxID=7167 RepID=UPI001640F5FA
MVFYNRILVIKVALAFSFLLILLKLLNCKQEWTFSGEKIRKRLDLNISSGETGSVRTHNSREGINATDATEIGSLPATTNAITKRPFRVTVGPVAQSNKEEEHASINVTFDICPPIPPNLVGPIRVDTNYEPLNVVEDRYRNKLQSGGQYAPPNCTARSRVAIIVPYRDREQQLPVFLKNLHPFLMKQQLEYGMYIVEQTPGLTFNKAMIMNIAFTEVMKLRSWECVIFHDIDMLPLDDRNLYACGNQPRHLSPIVDTLGPKLFYSTLFGGAIAMTAKQFRTVNGFSNSYWGWGAEDDDMANRYEAEMRFLI